MDEQQIAVLFQRLDNIESLLVQTVEAVWSFSVCACLALGVLLAFVFFRSR